MSIVFTELGIIKDVKASHEPKANALIVVNLEFSPKLTVSSLLDPKKADSPSVVTE